MRLTAAAPAPLDDAPPLWPPLLAVRGPGSASAGHAHHALHLVLALSGALRVRAGGAWSRAAGVLTAPDVPHAIDGSGAEVLLVFFDPESEVGQSLRAALTGPLRLLKPSERDRLVPAASPLELMQGPAGAAWAGEVARLLGSGAVQAARPIHPRVRRLLRHLRASPEADDSLEALAGVAGLSPGRLMHAFTASVGIPLRPYLAWLRLQRAAAAVTAGWPRWRPGSPMRRT